MAGKSKRPRLVLTSEEQKQIRQLRESQTEPWREVQRARILWRYHSGQSVAEIARAVKMTRKSVAKWIAKALAMGVGAALKDTYHRPKAPVITEEAKAWVVHLACSKPKELGYAAEVWTRKSLARHVREHAVEAGHPALSQAAKATVQRILAAQPLHPEKVKYYLERRDPDFMAKLREILLVYREVDLQNGNGRGLIPKIVTLAVDEKPGVQAIAKHATVARDHEYKRLGTCSILAALDLHSGHVVGACGAASPQPGVYCIVKRFGPLLSGGMHDPAGVGQSLCAYLQGNPSFPGQQTQSVQIRAYAYPRILAEHRGDPLRQDGSQVPAPCPGAILGGAAGPNSEGHRGNQCRSGRASMEEV